MSPAFAGPDFRRAAALTFGIWYLVLVSAYLTEAIAGRFEWPREMPADIIAVGIVAAMALSAWPQVVRAAESGAVLRWTLLGLATIAIALAQSGVNILENRVLGVIPAFEPDYFQLIRDRFSRSFRDHLFVTFANIALLVFLVQVRRSAEGRVQLAEARAAADRERLAALRFQLNPHFLFNTLNAVSSLVVVGRADDAECMIEQLSDFLRASLAGDPALPITLAEELAIAEAYLAIETVRFGERLQVVIDVPDALVTATVPGFILQPLLENAVKYAVAGRRERVTVTVRATVEGRRRLMLAVLDDGLGNAVERRPGLGVGVVNVRARLAASYGDAAGLELGPGEDGTGWAARLWLPFDTGMKD